uniref:Uncharacterized protein n=1 Tax=Micrurus corallinus TaxID=54390 RepID=A0A2D4EQG6_MICCO
MDQIPLQSKKPANHSHLNNPKTHKNRFSPSPREVQPSLAQPRVALQKFNLPGLPGEESRAPFSVRTVRKCPSDGKPSPSIIPASSPPSGVRQAGRILDFSTLPCTRASPRRPRRCPANARR